MKGTMTTIAVCALIAMPTASIAKPAAAPMKMIATGEGQWSVHCTLETRNGNIDREDLRGGKTGTASFTIRDLDHGSCDYSAAPGKPLVIAVEGLPCPLNSADATKCEQTLAAGAAGTIRLAAPRAQ